MTKLEEVARAIYKLTPDEVEERMSADAWRCRLGAARAAVEALRGFSEPMSQAGGAIGKYDIIPIGPNNPPVGQSIAERAYLALIDAILNEKLP